jgi:hypothetical protein
MDVSHVQLDKTKYVLIVLVDIHSIYQTIIQCVIIVEEVVSIVIQQIQQSVINVNKELI